MFRSFAAAEEDYCYDQGNYQNGESNCGYFCLRIAAEIVLGRTFDQAERTTFTNEFLGMCLVSGQRISESSAQFNEKFPEIDVYFKTEEANEYSPEAVVTKLDAGHQVLVLNIQNMNFRGNKLVKGRFGHNICCVGHEDGKLIFKDSNKYHGKCKKTMAISILQAGYDALKDAKDIDTRARALRQHPTHISEMFWTTREKPVRSTTIRRSRRRHG
tara:strand:- start:310 stop:954 length:645 start_codon:yes stop_codon:yes gene_type:complete